jgi:site-specific recombinase XerD
MVTLDNWQAQMREDMQLRDFSERTREAYELAMKLFLRWAECEPEALEEVRVKAYVLHLREKGRSPSSINIAVCGMRFFFTYTLPRDWGVFELLRVKHPSKLPIVLSTGEVLTLLASIRHPVRRMALTTIYALGLRLGEGLRLETSHIDGDRLFVAVRNGKGAKDRSVPLPRPLLARLRRYWKEERPKVPGSFLFVPARGESPLHETTLQKTFTAAQRECVPQKHATIHTLRHSYATHLVESGISVRTIQQLMGHKSMKTTEVYLHVTRPGTERLQDVLDRLMANI